MQHENHSLNREHHHSEKYAKNKNSHSHGEHGNHGAMVQDFKKRFWISLIVTIPVLLLSHTVRSFFGLEDILAFRGDVYILFILSSFIFFYGGWPFLTGFVTEISNRKPGMMTLIAVAITVAYLYSSLVVFGLPGMMFFWELATLIDIMLLGHWIEMKSVMGAGEALEKLAKLMPADAHKVIEGKVIDVPLSELVVGDHVLVKPGEKIPADGVVLKGETSVNESMLTGESKPVSKKTGETVIGGSINGEGSITVKVKKTGNDSFLSQVIDLVNQAKESKSKTQDIANRAASDR